MWKYVLLNTFKEKIKKNNFPYIPKLICDNKIQITKVKSTIDCTCGISLLLPQLITYTFISTMTMTMTYDPTNDYKTEFIVIYKLSYI